MIQRVKSLYYRHQNRPHVPQVPYVIGISIVVRTRVVGMNDSSSQAHRPVSYVFVCVVVHSSSHHTFILSIAELFLANSAK